VTTTSATADLLRSELQRVEPRDDGQLILGFEVARSPDDQMTPPFARAPPSCTAVSANQTSGIFLALRPVASAGRRIRRPSHRP